MGPFYELNSVAGFQLAAPIDDRFLLPQPVVF